MSTPTPAQAQALLTALTRALAGVAVLALVFTAVNVTLFATSRGVPWPIALLLDPMVALALAAILYADARLAAWNLRPPAWSTALRWFTGITATLMNTWESIWPTGAPTDRLPRPTGPFGWPTDPDPAGILLHAVPTVLLILLTETTAAYRRAVAPLLEQIDCADPSADPASCGSEPGRSHRSGKPPPSTALLTEPPPPGMPPRPAVSGPPTGSDAAGPVPGGSGPAPGPDAPAPGRPTDRDRPAVDGPTDADLRDRARALNTAAQAQTGRPVSTWRLRTTLHIGTARAEQIRTQLLTDRPTDPPTGHREPTDRHRPADPPADRAALS
ncbi:extensin [Streptomyces sp. 21So2-11]|uniref:extensin n=1 Tax=Streptomyces sp. 21So2-11 TaxID=3144408 RepID=UPI00321A6906